MSESTSNLCAANGCTLGASVGINGSRVCFVHAAVRERADWDRATLRLRRQQGLIEAIVRLRRGESPVEIECGMMVVLHLLPDGVAPSRFSCLASAEAALIAECTALESDGSSIADMVQLEQTVMSRGEKHDRAIENMRYLRDRGSRSFSFACSMYRQVYHCEPDFGDKAAA